MDYCDAPLFSPLVKIILDVGKMDRHRSVYLVNQVSLEFFDQYLRNTPSLILIKKLMSQNFITINNLILQYTNFLLLVDTFHLIFSRQKVAQERTLFDENQTSENWSLARPNHRSYTDNVTTSGSYAAQRLAYCDSCNSYGHLVVH